MKTIFITCFNGFISRNILSTSAFHALKSRPDVRIVIFAPENRASILRDEYGDANVLVEGIPVSSKVIEKPLERFLWVVATNLLRTHTRSIQRKVKFARDRNRADYLFSLFVSFLGRFRTVRALYRFFASHLLSGAEFERYFAAYSPSLLFSADVYTPQDIAIVQCARRRGVRVVGMVRSWDNVTSKTLLTFIPDSFVVNSERIKQEVVQYGDVPEKTISVVGVPHYDHYQPSQCAPRDQVLKKYGLHPGKKLIFFATPSDMYIENNPITPRVLNLLASVDAQVLVRMPLVGGVTMAGYQERPGVVFDNPGQYQDFNVMHIAGTEDQYLADSLNASDIVITWASTMIIDAAVFDKPIIVIGFDASPRPYTESIRRYYDYDHHHYILQQGAVQLVENPDQLLTWVKRYLEDPSLHSEARKKVIREYAGIVDGRAGERLGKVLVDSLVRA